MPKMKTHSASKKRFKLTGTGKIKRRRAMRSHNLEGKSKKLKRDFDKGILIHASQVPVVKKLLGKG